MTSGQWLGARAARITESDIEPAACGRLQGSPPVVTAFLLTAEEFGATEALRIGLVQEVVPRRSAARHDAVSGDRRLRRLR